MYQKLEHKYSSFIGVPYTVTTNTGTAALHLALEGKRYPKGSEIIVPESTMIATAWAVTYAGLNPVFVDCKEDFNINENLIEDAITDKTVAIMVTHVYGRVCSMESIEDLCNHYGLDLFEDCCEAQGARYHDGSREGSMVGSLGIGCFSFYKNKIIHAEEGGCITIPTEDTQYYKDLCDLKNMSFGKNHDYIHNGLGFNYRMPESTADKVLQSLCGVEWSLKQRETIAAAYDTHLLPEIVRSKRDVVWVYDINIPNPGKFVRLMNKMEVQARRTFAPMSRQPLYFDQDYAFTMSNTLYESTAYLPVYPLMSVEEVCTIANLTNMYYLSQYEDN